MTVSVARMLHGGNSYAAAVAVSWLSGFMCPHLGTERQQQQQQQQENQAEQ